MTANFTPLPRCAELWTLVTAYADRVGLEPADFGAHSLRAGFLTSAARRGASVFKMRDVSRHKSMDVLQAYVRDADLFRDHAGGQRLKLLHVAATGAQPHMIMPI